MLLWEMLVVLLLSLIRVNKYATRMTCYNGTRRIFLCYTWMLFSLSSRSKWPVHLENVCFYMQISRYIYRQVWVIHTALAHATSDAMHWLCNEAEWHIIMLSNINWLPKTKIKQTNNTGINPVKMHLCASHCTENSTGASANQSCYSALRH